MALGATHWSWRSDVRDVTRRIEARFPRVKCNTYRDHPWPGWDHRSIDVWYDGGRGDPLPTDLGWKVRTFVREMPGQPWIRHDIYEHSLWTSFGGLSHWHPNDHTGELRHYHVTFW